jgi:hypothetical protein
LKIPVAFSISFILLNVLHGHWEKSYIHFSLQLSSSEYNIKFNNKNSSLNSCQILQINTNIDFSASVALRELSVALSFDQLAQEKVWALVNPQPILSTSTLTHCEDFYYIQALLNRLL